MKIGAKAVRHGRYVTFQLAKVAVPHDLFREILRLIDGLHRSPAVPDRTKWATTQMMEGAVCTDEKKSAKIRPSAAPSTPNPVPYRQGLGPQYPDPALSAIMGFDEPSG